MVIIEVMLPGGERIIITEDERIRIVVTMAAITRMPN